MSKRISLLLLTIAFLSQANAQTQKRAVEFELAAGGIIASDKMFFQKNNIGLSPSLELRYNFRQVPVDLGLQWSAQVFSRTFRPYDHLGFLSQNITLTSDYNFRKYKHISFFCGARSRNSFDTKREKPKKTKPRISNIYRRSGRKLFLHNAENRSGVLGQAETYLII